jgi:hypothetical protein
MWENEVDWMISPLKLRLALVVLLHWPSAGNRMCDGHIVGLMA